MRDERQQALPMAQFPAKVIHTKTENMVTQLEVVLQYIHKNETFE